MRDAFERAQPSCWHDLVRFLEQEGLQATGTIPGESAHMIADAKQAMKDNVPFAYHPESAFRVMRSHRNPELVRQEEHYWLSRAEAKIPRPPQSGDFDGTPGRRG